ncbi:MAG TPA: HD domain-containing phosphohydrolase [Desulfuromonadales bacterium]|nr:HD domain-containing phosphohydrolase [Desulfuromonadales bacterium]
MAPGAGFGSSLLTLLTMQKFLHSKGQQPLAGGEPTRREQPAAAFTRWLQRRGGIRCKLALVTLALIALITTGSSLVVTHVLDESLLQSLVQRGRSLAISAATPAGYSILSGDRLALDNLAAKISESQEGVVYLAILDTQDTLLAHSRIGSVGGRFERLAGSEVAIEPDVAVRKVRRDGLSCFEFSTPIIFAGSRLGEVVVGIDPAAYNAAKRSARGKIILVSLLAMVVGLAGTLLLATLFTTPIKRLAAGVSRIRSGDYGVEVEVSSHDELGELTASFNAMATTIRAQRESLEGSARELEESYLSTVRILAAALDARDNYTLGHSARVATLSLRVGRRLGLGAGVLKELEMACFLHDIGKIRVPDHILNKPAPLQADEIRLIGLHPDQGAEILGLADSLHKYVPVVRHHHERYDGSGYPAGLKGEEIPLFAQIVAIADAYDAMTTSRPYRPGRSRDEAVGEILAFRGTQFAPHLTDLFIEALHEDDDPEFSLLGVATL